jgi:hypothetical protein
MMILTYMHYFRPFLHDILERRRVPHYAFKVLRAR